MKLHEKIVEQFLTWVYYWAHIYQGVIGVLTLGFWSPSASLKAITWVARYRWRHTKYQPD